MPETGAPAPASRISAPAATADPGTLLILYYRERPGEPEASQQALQRQYETRDRLVANGATIVGTFVENETAAAHETQARRALKAAYDAAVAAAGIGCACELVVLRVDAIGHGAPFPMFGAEVSFLETLPIVVRARYLGCAAFDRQLRHEWHHSTSAEASHPIGVSSTGD